MKLSIVIPTYKRRVSLDRLLWSILGCDLSGLGIEILVVDNEYDSATESLVLKHQFVKYFVADSIGVNKARNMGLKRSQGEVVLFFDDDCYIDDKLLIKKHLIFHQQSEDSTGLGGVYIPDNDVSVFGLAHWEGMMSWLLDVPDLRNTYRLIGGHASYKRSKLQDLMFDELISYGSAEVGFNQQLFERGHKLSLNCDLHLLHSFNLTQSEMEMKCRMQAENYARLFRDQKIKNLTPLDKTVNPNKDLGFINKVINKSLNVEEFNEVKKGRIELFWQVFLDQFKNQPT